MNYRLSLGKYFGIGLYVHWTFSLLIFLAAFRAIGTGIFGILFSVLILCSVFLCVTLHEYGHSLTARYFGISTVDITLFPIGGVARLERMPRIPWQELLVAVAGPAVNVVLASLLAIVLYFMGGFSLFIEPATDTGAAVVENASVVEPGQEISTPALAAEQAAAEAKLAEESNAQFFDQPSVLSYVLVMFIANTMLVLFNMIPAFPMDGGRVLRSLLAMVVNYRLATYIASRIGLLCAVGMGIFLMTREDPSQYWMLMLISVFIAYAGMAEARQVDVTEAVRGLIVSDVMIRHPIAVDMNTPLSQLVEDWRSIPATSLPVLAHSGIVVGMLRLSRVIEAVKGNVPLETTAGQLANHGVPSILSTGKLEEAVPMFTRTIRQLPVVDERHQLVGILDIDTVRSRGMIAQSLESPTTQPFPLDGSR